MIIFLFYIMFNKKMNIFNIKYIISFEKMNVSTRKPCINVSTATYIGKELSPLRFGQSAEGFELNTIMEGYDKQYWIVKMKNNRKVWIRELQNMNRMTHEEPIIAEENKKEEEIKEEPKIQNPTTVKKMTDYNVFLTYRLNEVKKTNNDKTKKEIFNEVVSEWKELKKSQAKLNEVMVKAYAFHNK